jgi:hypothetical protein
MKESPKRRKGESLLREWTERLNRFGEAKTAEERKAVLENALQINPGGTIRSMLEAWGYSSSGRGRKAKDAKAGKNDKPARARLEAALEQMFGGERNPVPSLYPKLSGSAEVTVQDAARITAALIASWPEPLRGIANAKTAEDRKRRVLTLNESFVQELLAELSDGQSREWTPADMRIRTFSLVDEERVAATQFIKEAGQKEGALIVAGARDILIGPTPIVVIKGFHELTLEFLSEGNQGILIFVFDASIFEGTDYNLNLLHNINLLATAVMAYALFEDTTGATRPIQKLTVDWSRWRRLASRCCVVMRRPPLIDPHTGELFTQHSFDDFVAGWRPKRDFARLEEFRGFMSFDTEHVLPRTYPAEFVEDTEWSGRELYWDTLVRPSADLPDVLDVEYFLPRPPRELPEGEGEGRNGRGRRSQATMPLEGDKLFYLVRKKSPGQAYDDAQRAIYRAARGRLALDRGERQTENLLAAAALRHIGFEVLPISVAVTLLPRSLYFAATEQQDV